MKVASAIWILACLAIVTPGGLCAESAGADRPASPGGLTVYNKGIGGNNSRAGRARFEKDVLALKPDFVFIYFGLNDTLNERAFVPLEEFVDNLTWMVRSARPAGIRPVLCTIHHVKEEPLLKRHKRESYGAEGPNGKIDRYNKAIRALAGENKVPLADFHEAVKKANRETPKGDVNKPVELVSRDGVHLTVAGNRLLAECFFTVVASRIAGNETIVCLGDSVTFGSGTKGAGTAEGDTYPAMLRRMRPPGKSSHGR